MSRECLDCALFECDSCELVQPEPGGGCCCGRIPSTRDDSEDDDLYDEPTALEQVQALAQAGQIRICRQSKPLTEHDARLLLEFHDHLSNLPPKETP